ncbi:MAG: GNAT family protein [Candidatus Peregrinibacteria bacterium]|nr:GNAT family protein [Candidatus Peregrinibacteria bacterium]
MEKLTTKKGLRVALRILRKPDLQAILDLQDFVCESLPDKTLLIPASEQFLSNHLEVKQGAVYGIFHKNELIAYSILHFPGNDEDNLGVDIGLSKDELNKVAHLEIQMVHPDFRGNNFQNILNDVMLKEAKEKGYLHLLCTVSPDNIVSHKNLEKIGMIVMKTKFKYGGNKRDIMYMRLK